jgi:D-alanyl-lipoteichoic acid acyltransferase DltB (MBOAT superfamily)
MLFNSWTFAWFFALVLPLYYALDWRRQNIMLLVASYVFYGWWDWRFLFLLMLSTVVDFFVAKWMNATSDAVFRKQLMLTSVGLNLAYLGFFKYFNFFSDSLEHALAFFGIGHLDFFTIEVLLPVGISFYTFQSISYIVDVYRNSREHTDDFVAFALYLSYFPHLVAGPIQRSTQLLPQLLAPRTVGPQQFNSGVVLMLIGFFKKIAIADAVAPTVDRVFSQPDFLRSSPAHLEALYLFALQIYCDFSGYTDIARGVSRLMGIELRLNFRQPYLSANITEFWRRWHISLSEWLRDYVYVTLGGNRHGRWRTYRNLMITMLLGGLWHGAGWNFIVWGGLHGLYLSIHRAWSGSRRIDLDSRPDSILGWLRYLASVFLTFHLVCLTWIFFRARTLTDAGIYLHRLFQPTTDRMHVVLLSVSILCTLLLDVPSWYRNDEVPISPRWPAIIRGVAYGSMLGICAWVGADEAAAFIYFQF